MSRKLAILFSDLLAEEKCSLCHIVSLKSPIINHGSHAFGFILASKSHMWCLSWAFGSPYTKVPLHQSSQGLFRTRTLIYLGPIDNFIISTESSQYKAIPATLPLPLCSKQFLRPSLHLRFLTISLFCLVSETKTVEGRCVLTRHANS